MFTVEIKKSLFEDVILKDSESGVIAVVTPERGGMLTSIIKNGREYIYINKDNYNSDIRPSCAVPVLFPTVGRTKDEIITFNKKQYPMGIHGVVSNRKWNILNQNTENGASVTISVKSNEDSKKSYPFDFEVRLTFTLKGECITVDQEYINCANDTMPFTFGFHPYFCISNLDNLDFDINAENVYDAGNDVSMPFTGKLDKDLICGIGSIFTSTKKQTSFKDNVDNIGITVKYDSNFKYVVIWTNKKDKFVCIEPWSSIPNALNTDIDVSKIEAHESLKSQYSIEF